MAQAPAPLRRTPGVAAFVKAIDLAPENAVTLIVAPDPKSLGEDMGELAAKLDRMQALTELKPLDLVKSQLGIGPGMNDRGPIVAWYSIAADKTPQWCALIPTVDGAQFIQSNLEAAPDIAPDAYRRKGKTYYARVIDGFVVASPSADLERAYAAKPGLADRLKKRLGERGFAVLCDGEIGLWAGPESLAELRNSNRPQAAEKPQDKTAAPGEKGAAPSEASKENDKAAAKKIEDWQLRSEKLLAGLTDAVASVDVDPLGVLIRSYYVLDPESELGKSAHGGAHTGVSFSHLPRGFFVLALSADIAGLGGMQTFLDLAALVPGGEQAPSWLEQNKSLLTSIQLAIYPSKLGLMGGGLLNEAMLWLATTDGVKAKAVLEQWMVSLNGEADGQKREVTWEKDKTLKNGAVADAYQIKDTPLPRNGQPARRTNPMERMFRTLLYGPKGPCGFVKSCPDGVYVTFSQRPDVLERATGAAEKSLEGDDVLAVLRAWMMPKPDAMAFIGVGSLLNVVRQAANAFPGGGLEIPDAPPDLEPIAFAMTVEGGRIETATMIPTGVISVLVAAYADRRDAQIDDRKDPASTKDADEDTPTPPPAAKNPPAPAAP